MLRRHAGSSLRRALLFALLLSSAAPSRGEEAPAAATDSPPTWYALSLQSSDSGLQATHLWSKGRLLRSETLMGGVKVVTLVLGEDYVAYDALNGRGISIKRHPDSIALDSAGRRPFGNEYELMVARGAEAVGATEGPLTHLRLTDDFGRRELQVTDDPDRIPIKLEVWHRKSNQRYVIDYANWRKGLEIPDRFFEVEAGVEIQELSLEAYMALAASPEPEESVPILHADLLAPQP